MSDINTWSPIDDNNNTAPPNGWPEGQVPSSVNNCGRMMMGSIRRFYDSTVSGSLNLPYVPLAGGTITGNLAVNGTGGVALGATQLQNISNGLQVYNASGGSVQSRGPGAGMVIADRVSGSDWLWYASSGTMVLRNNADRVQVDANGNMLVSGSVNASLYGIDNLPVIDSGGGGILVYDGGGQVALQLYAANSYYNANMHQFRNDALGVTATIDAGGNLTMPGTVTAAVFHGISDSVINGTLTAANLTATSTVTAAYITSTGDVHANNAVTAPSITASGTVQGNYIHSTGAVDGTQLTSSGNINATNDIGCRDLFVRNINGSGALTSTGATIHGTAGIDNLNVGGTTNSGGTVINSNISCPGNVTAANFYGNFSGGGSTNINTGTVTSTTLNNSGTITTATLNNSGTITTANLSASSNVTASGTVTGNAMVCNGTMQVSGQTNLLGSLQVGPSGSYMRADSVGTYNVSGSWLTFSDRSVKEAITPYTAGLAEIEQLEPVSYTYSSEIEQVPVTRYGLVADDVAPVIPEMVGTGTTPGGQTLSTLANGHLTFVLINAVKTLSARVASLEQQVAAP